jgi:hypothetical protein
MIYFLEELATPERWAILWKMYSTRQKQFWVAAVVKHPAIGAFVIMVITGSTPR